MRTNTIRVPSASTDYASDLSTLANLRDEIAFARTMPPIPRQLLLRQTSHSTKLNLYPFEIPARDQDDTETIPACIEDNMSRFNASKASEEAHMAAFSQCSSGSQTARQPQPNSTSISEIQLPCPRPITRHIRRQSRISGLIQRSKLESQSGYPASSRVYEPHTYASHNTILTVPSGPEDASIVCTPVAQTHVKPRITAPQDPQPSMPSGTIIAGKYEIISEIAQGGYGTVYRAKQLGLNRMVALKRLHSNHSESIAQRFLLEADIIKKLIHPNTVQLIDAGSDNDNLYIVMEYIEGSSLHEMLRSRQTFDMMRAIHITCQILKSINEAHHCNIVHRDLKPSNILIRNVIGENDFVKVLDFGIAKARYKNAPLLTQDGTIMGTPQYIAPELLFGDSPQPSADIYGIGLMLAEMLTGHPVMPSDIQSIVRFAASPEPVHIPANLAESDLGPVLERALQKVPENRYQTAEEMLLDLQAIQHKHRMQHPAQSSNPSPQSQWKRYFTNIYRFTLIAMLLILTNVLLIVRFIL